MIDNIAFDIDVVSPQTFTFLPPFTVANGAPGLGTTITTAGLTGTYGPAATLTS